MAPKPPERSPLPPEPLHLPMLHLRDTTLHGLLPNEPRILNPAREAALTARYLLPRLQELEACLLAVRLQLDPALQRMQPVKLGKPYPVGQCLEIAQAVERRLRLVQEHDLPAAASEGLRALRDFRRAGGTFRQVWGDLRGEFFQNAFQVGMLYVDVANDTVTPTKPKVEILPFGQARFVPIRDFRHFAQLARQYWKDQVYPNHVLPMLAPHCPLIHVSPSGRVKLHEATHYMLAMTRRQGFAPSEDVLRDAPMPAELFEHVRASLRAAPQRIARSAEEGRDQALHQCRQQRAKRWHLNRQNLLAITPETRKVNSQLALHPLRPTPSEPSTKSPMNTLNIDGIQYDLDAFPAEAKEHLQSIRFVDQELARLQAHTAAMQTARNTYVAALKAAVSHLARGSDNTPDCRAS